MLKLGGALYHFPQESRPLQRALCEDLMSSDLRFIQLSLELTVRGGFEGAISGDREAS